MLMMLLFPLPRCDKALFAAIFGSLRFLSQLRSELGHQRHCFIDLYQVALEFL